MKTVTLKFVVQDDDERAIEEDIMRELESSSLNHYPLHSFFTQKSSKDEKKWLKKYENDR